MAKKIFLPMGLSIISLIISSPFASAQLIQGTVTDVTTRQPICGAHIQWNDSPVATTTNHRGEFALRRILSATTVRISAGGYAAVNRTITGDSEEISILMEPSPLILNQSITVTAQRYEKPSFDVVEAVTVVGDEQLLQNAPRTTSEALMNQPGIWVQKTNHGGGSPIIRGLVGNQVLLLIDGIRLNNATYRYGPNQYLSTVDPGLIEQIEVVRGSGSVLYGSDAIGGVVQLISKSPGFLMDKPHASSRISGKWMSGGMEKSSRAEIEIGDKRMAFLGGMSERHFGDIVAGGDLGTQKPSGYRERAADAKFLLRTGSSGMLTAAFQYLTQFKVPRYDQVVLGGYSTYNFDPQTRQLCYLKWETFLANPWIRSIRVTGSYNRSVEGIVSQRTNSSTIRKQRDEVRTFGLVAEIASNPSSQWRAQSGIEYYLDKVGSKARDVRTDILANTVVRGSYADGSTAQSLALFSNHQINWNGFQFLAGMRLNTVKVRVKDATFGNQRINPTAWVGNIGLMYDVTPKIRAILSVNTGFRAPNIDDMSKFGAVESAVFEIPAAKLAPERSWCVETGLKFNLQRFSGSFMAYQTQLSNLIDRVATTYNGSEFFDGRKVYQKQNVGKAVIRGFEADGEVSIFPALRASGNITYTRGENRTRHEPMRRIPPLSGRVGLHYRHQQGWWLKGELAAAAKQDRLAAGDKADVRISSRLVDGSMPGWTCWNLYAGYQFGSVRIQASFQNLFDKAYRVYGSGVDEYGRTVNVMLIYNLKNRVDSNLDVAPIP